MTVRGTSRRGNEFVALAEVRACDNGQLLSAFYLGFGEHPPDTTEWTCDEEWKGAPDRPDAGR